MQYLDRELVNLNIPIINILRLSEYHRLNTNVVFMCDDTDIFVRFYIEKGDKQPIYLIAVNDNIEMQKPESLGYKLILDIAFNNRLDIHCYEQETIFRCEDEEHVGWFNALVYQRQNTLLVIIKN